MRIANEPASESAPGTHRPVERPLYEPPRLRRKVEGKRPTSWLEFFFDLVFVVAVDQVARRLQHDVTTLAPRSTAMWYASSCSGMLARIGVSASCVRGMRIPHTPA